jgi:uncharacterized protein (TIGR02246 family)
MVPSRPAGFEPTPPLTSITYSACHQFAPALANVRKRQSLLIIKQLSMKAGASGHEVHHECSIAQEQNIMRTSLVPRFSRTMGSAWVVFIALVFISSATAAAGPAEEANAVIDRWSAAYTSNDPDAVVANYAADAILLGTVSPVISVGTEAIRTYFAAVKGSGNKNAIGERHTIVLSDNAVLVTGFYEFTRMKDGQPVSGPSRFTMLVVKNGADWRIAHHHSSPHVQPKG